MAYWSIKTDDIQAFAYMNKVFTPEECQKIIDLANSKPKMMAEVNNTQQSYNPDLRKNKIVWIDYNDGDLAWAYRKLIDVGTKLNDQYFKFDLYGIGEKLQFSEYSEPGDGFKSHIDKTFNGVIRKLTLVVQLTDPKEYEGSNLLLHIGSIPDVMKNDQGTVLAFPGYALHEVTPLISGTRYTLVVWFTGPNFK